jgi:glycosyltransferase involved in cell wall biosynthesis
MPPSAIDISVVLPLYRTAAAVTELHRRLTHVLSGRSYELIFVDDACPDDSASVVQTLAARDPHVVLLCNPSNQGQQRTVRRGLSQARGRYIVIMDADLQDPPEHLPILLHALAEGGVEAVFAGRRGRYQASSRMLTSRVFKTVMHLVSGVPPDAGSYVAMTRKMADAILRIRTRSPYMLALIGGTALPVRSVALPREIRPSGTSAYSEWGRIRFAWSGLRAALEVKWTTRSNRA